MDSLGKGRMHFNFKVQDWGFKERLTPSGCGDGVYGAADAGALALQHCTSVLVLSRCVMGHI